MCTHLYLLVSSLWHIVAFSTVGGIKINYYICFINVGCRFIQSIRSAPEKLHKLEPSSAISVLAVRCLTVAETERNTGCLIKWE